MISFYMKIIHQYLLNSQFILMNQLKFTRCLCPTKPQERQWLMLYLEGYKQYEIADIMSLSTSTIKLIKASVKRKCQRF